MPVHSIGRYNIGSMAKYGGFKGRSFAKLQNQVNNLPTTGSECSHDLLESDRKHGSAFHACQHSQKRRKPIDWTLTTVC
jgi:hypothetical protein